MGCRALSVCMQDGKVRASKDGQSLYVSVMDVQSCVSICPSVETASICSDSQFSSVRKTVFDCRDSQHASVGTDSVHTSWCGT